MRIAVAAYPGHPAERLQAVEVVRPVLARLFGLAELRAWRSWATKTEAPLAFLRVDEATALRQRLLGLGASAFGPPQHRAGDHGGRAAGAAVDNRDLLVSQLLRPQWWTLPLAIAAPIAYFAFENDLSAIAILSTATAVIGAVQAPVRVVLGDWRFRIGMAHDGLRLPLTCWRPVATVPPGRVQSAAVQWPLLWRGFGWVRVQMHIAGIADDGEQRAGLLPVGTVPVAEHVIAEALPGFTLTSVVVNPVPKRARWLAPLRRRVLGYQLAATAFVTRDGLLTRQLIIVPYARIQSVRIRQGPLQRMLRLATVSRHAGGGLAGVAPRVDVTSAPAASASGHCARPEDRGWAPTAWKPPSA
jgi:putative membrane protein